MLAVAACLAAAVAVVAGAHFVPPGPTLESRLLHRPIPVFAVVGGCMIGATLLIARVLDRWHE